MRHVYLSMCKCMDMGMAMDMGMGMGMWTSVCTSVVARVRAWDAVE